MARRLELHKMLESIVGKNVYFQPPESMKLNYPCMFYSLEAVEVRYADNGSYKTINRYNLIYIDRDPDSEIPERILKLPYCRFDRFYRAENLNHWSFDLYF